MSGSAGIAAWLALVPSLLGWLLPGWQLARRFALPAPIVSAFLLSACGWFALVLGLQLLGVPLIRPILLPLWLGAGVAASLWLWKSGPRPAPPRTEETLLPRRIDWPWLPAVVIGAIGLGFRAFLDPSNGWDTSFRWDHLARLMVDHGNLDFYPPVTAEHYELYAWCDGIPPLASLLNLWIYLACDSADPTLLAGRTIGEVAITVIVVGRLAVRLHGRGAVWPALAVLSACALFSWSLSMGQETGLSAVAVIALVYYLIEYKETRAAGAALGAGLAATVAAISRDYAVAYAAVGLGLLLLSGGFRRRPLAAYLLPVCLVALPWYARNWALTGNPLFPNPLFGIFPGEPALDRILAGVFDYWSFSSRFVHLPGLLRSLGFIAGASLLGWAGFAFSRQGRVVLAAILLLSLGLWAWSAQLTAGGWNYSLRVLAPSVGLLAASAGWLVGAKPALRHVVAILLLTLSVDAARRAWHLPHQPAAPPIPYTFEQWRDFEKFAQQLETAPFWTHLARLSAGETILVDSPSTHVLIGSHGGKACMFFSPAARPCLAADQVFADTLAALRSNGIRFALISIGDPITDSFVSAHPFLKQLCALPPNRLIGALAIYDLASLPAAPLAP
jgi:hypothetical protein